MIRGKRLSAPLLLSATLAALCLAGLAGSTARAEPTAPAMQESTINPLRSIDPESLTGFRDKPLFEASRRRFVAPRAVPEPVPVAQVPAAPAPTPAPNLQLLGLLRIDGSDLAIVRDLADRKIHRLLTGDIIQAWTVTIVSHAAIELSRDEDRQELRMFSRRAGQDRSDADDPQEEEPPPVKVPELTIEMFKKRYRVDPSQQ